MARYRRKKSRSRHGKKVPILATAGMGMYALNAYTAYREQGIPGLKYRAFGIQNDGKFDPNMAMTALAPPILGAIGSKLASRFGLNRMFANVPLLKL